MLIFGLYLSSGWTPGLQNSSVEEIYGASSGNG